MKNIYMILISLILVVGSAWARKPAVEDFVGIEYNDEVVPTPQGTEALFNFSNEVGEHKITPVVLRQPNGEELTIKNEQTTSTSTFPWMELLGLLAVITLPMVSFIVIQNKEATQLAEVKDLSSYRETIKAKEQSNEDEKKAS